MPIPLAAAAAIAALGKGVGSILKSKGQNKKNQEAYRSTVAAKNLAQKQVEDKRIGNLSLANSLLSRVPKTTAGGAVNTNVALDPALVAQLSKPREYDYASATPKPVGGTYDLLAGLFDTAGDVATYLPTGKPPVSAGVGGATRLAPTAPIEPMNPDWMKPKPLLSIQDLLALQDDGQ